MMEKGICISRPPALCLAPSPGPGPRPRTPALALNLYLLALAPNLYLPAQSGLSLHIPTLSPQFVFAGPGLLIVRTQVAMLIYPR